MVTGKALEPEYKKAAEQLASYEPKVVLAKVDATEEKKSATEYGVEGFPTLKWFVNGKPQEYSGGRTADTIVSWVQKKTGPATKTIASVDELTKFKVRGRARMGRRRGEGLTHGLNGHRTLPKSSSWARLRAATRCRPLRKPPRLTTTCLTRPSSTRGAPRGLCCL